MENTAKTILIVTAVAVGGYLLYKGYKLATAPIKANQTDAVERQPGQKQPLSFQDQLKNIGAGIIRSTAESLFPGSQTGRIDF